MSTFDPTPLLTSMSASGAWTSPDAFTLAPIPGMGVGALAARDLPAGTPLFHLPLGYLLTPWTSALGPALCATPEGKEAWDALAEKGWARLMLCMMYEESLGAQSKWAGYLASMPREFGAPMWWSDEELEALKGTDIEDRIGKTSANELYNTTLAPLMAAHPALFPPSEHFSLHNFHVQGSRILSRSFTVPVTRAGGPPPGTDDDGDEEEEDEVAVMVPMADMLNAAYEMDNARLFADGEDGEEEGEEAVKEFGEGYTMITTREIKQGEQIYNTYASPPNSELLRKYGHVDDLPLPSHIVSLLTPEELGGHPKGNAGDDVEIPGDLVLASAAALASVPAEMLQPRVDWWLDEGQEDAFSLSYPDEEGDDALPPALIAFARLLSSDAEWARAQGKGKLPRPTMDAGAAKVILGAVAARREKHVLPVENDLEIIRGQPGRMRDAAVVRLGEKRVLGVVGRMVEAEVQKLAEAERKEANGGKRKAEDAGRGGKKRR